MSKRKAKKILLKNGFSRNEINAQFAMINFMRKSIKKSKKLGCPPF